VLGRPGGSDDRMTDTAEPAASEDRVEIRVPEEHAGARLDHLLATLLPDRSRAFVQRLIKADRVRVDDASAKPSTVPRAGARIVVTIPTPVSPRLDPEALDLDIVHEDADLVVVNKPPGMVVHPAAGHARGTLVNALLHHVHDLSGIGGEERPGIVHRLDKGTSGLLVVAKHDQAHRELSRQFRDREIDKEYVALVWGKVQAGRRIDLPIGRDRAARQRMTTRARRARTAVTRIVKAEPLEGLTLVHVAIATGRTHQIRVHLAAIGHAVVGDAVYGGTRRRLTPRHRVVAQLTRPFLHASRLAFTHPRDARRVEFRAPMPDDLERVLEALRDR